MTVNIGSYPCVPWSVCGGIMCFLGAFVWVFGGDCWVVNRWLLLLMWVTEGFCL